MQDDKVNLEIEHDDEFIEKLKQAKIKAGSKPKHDPAIIKEQIRAYIDNTEYPMIKEFCLSTKIPYATLYKLRQSNEELDELCLECIMKAECYIEKGALHERLSAPFSQFRLKQRDMNWDDKHQIETIAQVDLQKITEAEVWEKIKQLSAEFKEADTDE